MLVFITGLVVGFVAGVLFGRKNKSKVESAVAKVNEQLSKK